MAAVGDRDDADRGRPHIEHPTQHRTILAVDIEKFSDPARTNLHRIEARKGVYDAMRSAFANIGLAWDESYHEDCGDGMFVLISESVPKNLVATRFPLEFASFLHSYNATAVEPARVRLRMVVHAGELHRDAYGIVGVAIVHAFRLLDSADLRASLSDSPGVLAMIVSEWFYNEVVRHEPACSPDTYRPVVVSVKETTTNAWICLPDHPYPHATHNPYKRTPKISGSSTPAPRQLPAPMSGFVGRDRELKALTDWMSPSNPEMAISVIGGMGGIGKTWLAVHWAHRHAEEFPDGQLYVNLHGFDPLSEPTSPAVAVRGFLDAMGVHSAAVPIDLEARTALYRSLVADRRMLIVLDNARDASQIVPLLPGTPTCLVLVTSRHHLTGLTTRHGAHSIDLDTLDDADARDLLVQHTGTDRLLAEPEAVTELLARCAGLPLALGIIAAQASAHPTFPLAALATDLRQAADRLDALDTGDPDTSMRVVLSSSYNTLDRDTAVMFRLLGAAPSPDIGLPAVTSLVGLSAAKSRALLRRLEQASLVQQHLPNRYRLHDLARLYAVEQAGQDTTDAQEQALRRLVEFYTHTALASDLLLYPHGQRMTLGPPVDGVQPQPPTDGATALEWFLTEHQHLLAAQQLAVDRGWHVLVWHLAWALDTFHWWRGHLHDNLASWRLGQAAADHLGADRQAHTHWLLGDTYSALGLVSQALDHLDRALLLGQEAGEAYAQARAHDILAQVWEEQGDHRQALSHSQQALDLYQSLDRPVWEANALNDIGWYHDRLGNHEQAREYCEQALTMHRQHNNPSGQATTLNSLGHIAHRATQHADAVNFHRAAFDLLREIGDLYEAAQTLIDLGAAYIALGDLDQARETWQEGLTICRAQRRSAAVEALESQLAALQ